MPDNEHEWILKACPHCRRPAEWVQRDRVSHGWYCSHHQDDDHPKSFYGYLSRSGRDQVIEIRVREVPDHDQVQALVENWLTKVYPRAWQRSFVARGIVKDLFGDDELPVVDD